MLFVEENEALKPVNHLWHEVIVSITPGINFNMRSLNNNSNRIKTINQIKKQFFNKNLTFLDSNFISKEK